MCLLYIQRMSNLFYAKCCAIFSASGLVFLFSLGVLLDSQPLYVKGPHDKEAASTNCYSAAGMYASSLFISLIYWCYHGSSSANTSAYRDTNGGNYNRGNWANDNDNMEGVNSDNDNVRQRRNNIGGGRRYEELQTFDNEIF